MIATTAVASLVLASMPPPDRTFRYTSGGVHYRCAQWGGPPKAFIIACTPTKSTKSTPKGAA